MATLSRPRRRTITYEDALRFGLIHRETYEQLDSHLVSVAAGTVADRVRDAAMGIAHFAE